jgi:GAF domain-containing protein
VSGQTAQIDEHSLRDRLAQLEAEIARLTAGHGVLRAEASLSAETPVVTADEETLGHALQVVLGEMRKVVPYDSASVQELRDGKRLTIVAGVGFADLDVILGESFEIDNADSPNGEVIHRRRPLIVADTEQYRAFRRGLHVGLNIRSWLGVPLIHHDELAGMLSLDKAEADFYTIEHERLALAFAGMIASLLTAR